MLMTEPLQAVSITLALLKHDSVEVDRLLALVDKFLSRIRSISDTTSTLEVLAELSATLGFRSAVLVEYKSGSRELAYMLDTDAARGDWWDEYVRRGIRERAAETAEQLRGNSVIRLTADRYEGREDGDFEFMRELDLLDCLAVPVIETEDLVGAAVFSGSADLSDTQHMALQLIVYNLFAQVRAFNGEGKHAPKAKITPREREVMILVAEGKTSTVIAKELGLSARTVNQHIENVAVKLGTKNRVQTAAEAIRFGLLH